MRAVVLWILSSCWYIALGESQQHKPNSSSSDTLPRTLETSTGYYCHLRCIAKCIDEHKVSDAEDGNCSSICAPYRNEHLCNPADHGCWTKCKELFNATGVPPKAAENVTVSFSTKPRPTPHEADLKWEPVRGAIFYLVQYTERKGADSTQNYWKGENDGNKTTSTAWHFKKPSLCAQYSFRMAAVNQFGVGSFSSVVTLPTPTPVIEKATYNLSSIELLHTPFKGITPNDPSYNSTVRLVVSYVAPSGWDVKNEIVRAEPNFHVINLQVATGEPVAPYVRQVDGTTQFEILLPGDVAFSDSRSEAVFGVERLFTVCNPTMPVEYQTDASQFLYLSFNCADVRGGLCPRARPIAPDCNLAWANATFICTNETHANVTVNFAKTSLNHSVQYYTAIYGTLNRHQDGSPVPVILPWQDPQLEIIQSDGSSFSMPELPVNKYYETSICAIFDETTLPSINWNITRRFSIDSSSSSSSSEGAGGGRDICAQPTSATMMTSSRNLIAVLVISLALSLLIAFFIAAFLYAKVRRRRAKMLAELANLDKNGALDGMINGYVDMPRLHDRWEIPRSHLTVYEDKKLGSGAFGAVYIGKIRGKALMNKNAQSVLAENWMSAEDCEVAVKYLHAYADESAKSEFRKEINLMKQLGHHERLVNMLCCISADEPLSLIVEYCSEGDLLHYLRDRCKYMVKLQDQGIDLSNIPEDYDADLNYILTMKDLLMFSWQISVGLEYLSEKNYIHRDVAARNVMVDAGKKAKIGDFGLCRYSCSDPIYMGKGGRLPWKWMAMEAIKNYEFTTKSDVWSYGVLLFEIVTLGGSPYPGVDPSVMEKYLEDGNRMAQPDNCPDEFYALMLECWNADPEKRPTFTELRERLSKQLEDITEDYSYLQLNKSRDYYNMTNQQYNTNTSRPQYPSSFPAICDDDDFGHRFEPAPSTADDGATTSASVDVNAAIGSEQPEFLAETGRNHASVIKSKSFPIPTGGELTIASSENADSTVSTADVSSTDHEQAHKISELKHASSAAEQLDNTLPEIRKTSCVNPLYIEQMDDKPAKHDGTQEKRGKISI